MRLEEGDIGRLAGFLGLDVHAFVARFTRLRPNRAGLALVDRPDGVGECVFLENNLCRAHEVKPLQCRGFPNDWNFPGWRKFCRAIPQKKLASPETRGS